MTKVLHSDFGAKLMTRSVPTHLHCFTATARIIHNVIYNLVTMTTVIHSVVTRCESSLLLSLSQHQNQSMRIIKPFLVSFRLFFSTHITPFADLLLQFGHEFPKLIGCEWKFFVLFLKRSDSWMNHYQDNVRNLKGLKNNKIACVFII